MPLCLCGAILLGACANDKRSAGGTITPPTPTLFAATPTSAAIARPPQTPLTTPPPANRTRAEAFLRRIAPSSADVPAGAAEQPTRFLEGPQLTPADTTPVFSQETGFDWTGGNQGPPGGQVLSVRHQGFAFATEQSARAGFSTLSDSMQAGVRGGLLNRVQDPKLERIDDLRLGDETIAWRASGPGAGTPGQEAVRWGVAVRRGGAAFTLIVDGTGAAPDTLARDLARRLDQRLANALPSGWP